MKACLCVLALLLGFVIVARAEPPAMIIVLLPGTSLAEWTKADAPHLHQLMQTGALAVMNTRTARQANDHTRESPESALLTLGAGARATGVPGQSVDYDLHCGNLADTLTARSIVIEAGGDSGAALVAADGSRRVSRTNRLMARLGVCLLWDAGPDLVRADAVLGAAADQISHLSGRLIVVSPYAGDSDYAAGHRLTPILEWGHNIPAGLLYSPSTRRAGLVTNTDFAPSVADYFGIKREEFATLPFGTAWRPEPTADAVPAVERIEASAVQQMSGMRVLPYLAAALAFWIVLCTWLSYRRRLFMLGPLLPIAALAAALTAVSAVSFGVALYAVTAVAWLVARRLGSSKTVTMLAAFSAAALCADMLTGSHWMRQSLLGYSAIEGARYYGLGNESMGLLLGTALVTAARFWPGHRAGRWTAACMLACLCLVLGSLGAKAGGLLVSVAAFGTFLYRANGGRWSGRTILALSGIVVAMMTALAFVDAFLLPHSSSHIGEAVRRITRGGAGEAFDIIRRKVAVESHLAYHSTWALLLWGGLGSLWALWKRRGPGDDTTQAVRQAGLVGITACLVLNDAGVVAAALFVTVLWSDTAARIDEAPASAFAEAGAGSKRVVPDY